MNSRSSFQILARSGYVARGIVFIVLAGLSLFTGAATTQSALDSLFAQSFGQLWIGLVGVGLLGFVAWRLAQSIANADGHKQDLKGYVIRTMLFGSAIVYIGLSLHSFQHVLGTSSTGGSGGEKDLAGWVMSQPFGRYLAALIGAGLVIGGGVTAAKGLTRKYERYLEPHVKENTLIRFICVYGLAARGMLFCIIGSFFTYAAFTVAPDQAGSTADALNWLRQLPFGRVLYIIAAVGLFSFGLYNLIAGRYRIVRAPDLGGNKQKAALVRIPRVRAK